MQILSARKRCGPAPSRLRLVKVTRKHASLSISIIGILLLVPELLWLSLSRTRVTEHDAVVALEPLLRTHLDDITHWPATFTLVMPGTPQWNRIRSVWGEPDFVLTMVDKLGRNLLCWQTGPLRAELFDAKRNTVPLRPGAGPYGYSTTCESSSVRFKAPAGSSLTLSVENTGIQTLPTADMIVVADCYNTKDKLVGLMLDGEVNSLLKWTCALGAVLILFGAVLYAKSRDRQK